MLSISVSLALWPFTRPPVAPEPTSVSHPAVLSATYTMAPAPDPSLMPSPSPSPVPAVSTRAKRTPAPSTSTASDGRFGIATGSSLTSLSQAELDRRLDGMRALGISWVRYDIEWSNIERSPGAYDWSSYDRLVRAVSARGLQSLAILDYTPTWARRSDCTDSDKCTPADPAAYGRFAAAAAARYQSYGVHSWEIWNEPNSQDFFQPAANPTAYTALLREAYTAIKRVSPGSTVITGGTSPAETGDGYYMSTDFLRGIYAAGGRSYFDAVSHHPYTFPYPVSSSNPDDAWGQLATLRQIMVNNGDGAKQIWATESGAPTGGPDANWYVSEAMQARIATEAIAAWRRLPWGGPFLWYAYQDAGTTPDTNENFFGLLRANGTPKAAYSAFQQAIR